MGEPIHSDIRLSGRDLVETVMNRAGSGEFHPTTGRLIAGSDTRNFEAKVAGIVSNAKAETFKRCLDWNSKWFLRRQALTYPGDAEDVAWNGDGTVLLEPVFAMSGIEDMRGSDPVPIHWISWDERHIRKWDEGLASSSRYLAAQRGDRLALVPTPGNGIPIRVSYVQVPERVDPQGTRPDPDIPAYMVEAILWRGAQSLLATERKNNNQIDNEVRVALEVLRKFVARGPVRGPKYATVTLYDE